MSKYWTSSVSRVDGDQVLIRGYDLESLIGGQSFTSSAFLLLRGRLPTPGEVRVLDAVLNAVLDYALLKPGTVAARYAVSANPSMVAGLATAVLSVGQFTLAPENTAKFVNESIARHHAAGDGTTLEQTAAAIVEEAVAHRHRIPGLGHPRFKRVDPRAAKLKAIAVEEGLWSERGDLYELIHARFVTAINKPDIPINDVGMMAVVLLELGFTPDEMTGLAVMSTMPGLIAHISEEMRTGLPIRVVADEQVDYGELVRHDFAADRTAAGWNAEDDA
jgi:citryl-CoA lyase